MAEIKSALELALARTEGMEIDKSKVQAKEVKIKGRKAALSFIEAKIDDKDFLKEFKQQKGDQKKFFIGGAAEILMSCLKLPHDPSYKEDLSKAAHGMELLSNQTGSINQMFEQLSSFFDQYLQNREQLEAQLTAQFAPLIKQKEEALYAQTGSRISISPMDDPDFQQAYSQNIENLSKNYLEALEQAKQQLKSFLEIE